MYDRDRVTGDVDTYRMWIMNHREHQSGSGSRVLASAGAEHQRNWVKVCSASQCECVSTRVTRTSRYEWDERRG